MRLIRRVYEHWTATDVLELASPKTKTLILLTNRIFEVQTSKFLPKKKQLGGGVTVRYVFDTGGGAIGYVAMLEIFLF